MKRALLILCALALPGCTGGGAIYENDNGPRGPERIALPSYGVQYPGFMEGKKCCPPVTAEK